MKNFGFILFFSFLITVKGETPLRYEIQEEQVSGSSVGNIKSDSGLQDRADVEFKILGTPEMAFVIGLSDGVLKTNEKIDRDLHCPGEEQCMRELRIIASNNGDFSSIIKVEVTVNDINDNVPRFSESQLTHEMPESKPIGEKFTIPSAVDTDSPVNGVQRYELKAPSDTLEKFELSVTENLDGSKDIRIALKQELDREDKDSYQMQVYAYDTEDLNPTTFGKLDVVVIVTDVNDNSPVFDNPTYKVTVREDVKVDEVLTIVHASDKDIGSNGQVTYALSRQTSTLHGGTFDVRNISGEIFVKGEVDYEKYSVYNLYVVAKDQGANPLTAEAVVVVDVIDVNDNAPEITVHSVSSPGADSVIVEEGQATNQFVALLTVEDPDQGVNGEFSCSLSETDFSLEDLLDGEYKITVLKELDRESQSEYNLAIVCTDKGDQPLSSTKNLKVIVGDINDNKPIFTHSSYAATIAENNNIGGYIVTVNATDADEGDNAEMIYSLHSDAGDLFHIDPLSGTISAKEIFDHEQAKEIRFRVVVTDRGTPPLSTTTQVVLTVADTNDERPIFIKSSYSFDVDENKPEGTEIGSVSAVDKDGPLYNKVDYTFIPSLDANYFRIDTNFGRVSTRRHLDRELQSSYRLIVKASDSDRPSLSSTVTLSVIVNDINDNSPVFEFPNDKQDTVYISNLVPVGSNVSMIRAYDIDDGQNSLISYSLIFNEDSKQFDLDPFTRQLVTNGDISGVKYASYNLTISATDYGNPPNVQLTNLYVIVNQSIAFLPITGKLMAGPNFIIVITLGCICGIAIVVLVIAIIALWRRDKLRKDRRKRVLEALRSPALAQDVNNSMESTDSLGVSKPKSGPLFNSTFDTIKDYKYQNSVNSQSFMETDTRTYNSHTVPDQQFQVPPRSSHLETTCYTPPWPDQAPTKPPRSSSLYVQPKPSTASDNPYSGLRVHDYQPSQQYKPPPAEYTGAPSSHYNNNQQMLHSIRDGDTHSASSSEVSNADSGRGPSEEGDHRHLSQHKDHPPLPPKIPNRQSGRKQRLLTMV